MKSSSDAAPALAGAMAPLILVSANQAWNIVNFRAGLIASLIAEGYRVIVAVPPDPKMEVALVALGCTVVPVPIDPSGVSVRRDLATLVRYWRIFHRLRPAAYLGWTIKPNVYGSIAARLTSVPSFPNISGLGTAFIRQSLLTRVVQRLYSAAFTRVATVFFQNDDDAALFVKQGLVRPEQVARLPGSGIDVARFTPPPGGRPRCRRFVLIARLLGDKGVREFVTAAREVRETWPDARFDLVGPLAGDKNRTAIGPDEVAGWLAEGTIASHTELDDVRPAIAAADFVVLPSYREGLSRVLLEAAAMGRPIVTTDVPGCRDVVNDGVEGYLCAPRDAASLAQALLRAAQTDDARWQVMAEAARARAVGEFSEATVFERYRAAFVRAGVPSP